MYDTFAFFVRISSIYVIIYMKRGVTMSSRFLGPTAEEAINKANESWEERMAEQRRKRKEKELQMAEERRKRREKCLRMEELRRKRKESDINKAHEDFQERMAEQRSKMTKEDFQRLGEYFDSVLQMQEETLHDSHSKTLKRTNNK